MIPEKTTQEWVILTRLELPLPNMAHEERIIPVFCTCFVRRHWVESVLPVCGKGPDRRSRATVR